MAEAIKLVFHGPALSGRCRYASMSHYIALDDGLVGHRENFLLSPGSTFCADSYFGIRSTPVLPQ